jgi:hypothetical protein
MFEPFILHWFFLCFLTISPSCVSSLKFSRREKYFQKKKKKKIEILENEKALNNNAPENIFFKKRKVNVRSSKKVFEKFRNQKREL